MEKDKEFKQEHPEPATKHDQPIQLIKLKEELAIEEIENLVFIYDENQDGEISAIEAQENDNHESLYQALIKLGVSADALKSVLGIESKDARKERQDSDRSRRKAQSNSRNANKKQSGGASMEYKLLTADELNLKYTLGDAKRVAKELSIPFKANTKELELWTLIKSTIK